MRIRLLALALVTATTGFTASAAPREYYGTLEPFASRAVYFLMTDRFVNGDESNDQRGQGGVNRSFDRPVPGAAAGEPNNSRASALLRTTTCRRATSSPPPAT